MVAARLPWSPNPYRLIGLEEMREFAAHVFYALGTVLPQFEALAGEQGNALVSEKNKDALAKLVVATVRECGECGLESSVDTFRRLAESVHVDSLTYRQVNVLLAELRGRLRDDLRRPKFLYLSRDEQRRYDEIQAFGDKVAAAFPSAGYDIEEASKCLALNRYTACVVHLMRALEVGLDAVAASLGLAWPDNPTWQKIINDINGKIGARSKAWKRRHEEFYAGIVTHIGAIKTAVRNPVMHARTRYDEIPAIRILGAVDGLMRHLATRLKERTRKR